MTASPARTNRSAGMLAGQPVRQSPPPYRSHPRPPTSGQSYAYEIGSFSPENRPTVAPTDVTGPYVSPTANHLPPSRIRTCTGAQVSTYRPQATSPDSADKSQKLRS